MHNIFGKLVYSAVFSVLLAASLQDVASAEEPSGDRVEPSTKVELKTSVSITRCDDDPGDDLSTKITSLPGGGLLLSFWASHGTMDRVPSSNVTAWYQDGELRVLYDIVPINRDPAPKGEILWACLSFTRIEVSIPNLPGVVDKVRIFVTRSQTVETTQIDRDGEEWTSRTLPDSP